MFLLTAKNCLDTKVLHTNAIFWELNSFLSVLVITCHLSCDLFNRLLRAEYKNQRARNDTADHNLDILVFTLWSGAVFLPFFIIIYWEPPHSFPPSECKHPRGEVCFQFFSVFFKWIPPLCLRGSVEPGNLGMTRQPSLPILPGL